MGFRRRRSEPPTWWPLDTLVDLGRKLWFLSRVTMKLWLVGNQACQSHTAVGL